MPVIMTSQPFDTTLPVKYQALWLFSDPDPLDLKLFCPTGGQIRLSDSIKMIRKDESERPCLGNDTCINDSTGDLIKSLLDNRPGIYREDTNLDIVKPPDILSISFPATWEQSHFNNSPGWSEEINK